MAWTEELKEQVIKMYKDADPTPETSTEIIKDIAEEIEQSPNGVRMILVQSGVYVKKEATSGTATKKSSSGSEGGSGRVSKEASIGALKALIKARGKSVNDELLDKLTGKAAVYLAEVMA